MSSVVKKKVLRKGWKGGRKKTANNLLSHERKKEIKETKKLKAEADRKIISELKEQKRAYFEKQKEKFKKSK